MGLLMKHLSLSSCFTSWKVFGFLCSSQTKLMGNRSFLEKGGKEYRLDAEGT
jgi:hypothetical protein